jgi:hypothetical protein
MMILRNFTKADIILLLVLMGAIAASFVSVYAHATGGSDIVVQVDSRTVYKARLNENGKHSIDGIRGRLVVEVKDGMVCVAEADCPNHICIRMGWRSLAGDVIVCVPNKTVVRITGSTHEDVRAVTG